MEIGRVLQEARGFLAATFLMGALWLFLSVLLGLLFVPGPAWVPFLVGMGFFAVGLWWVKKAFRTIAGDVPRWIVIGRFGRPTDALRPGLYFRPLWPAEKMVFFPTNREGMDFRSARVYTGRKDGFAPVPVTVGFRVYIQWPDPEEHYHVPTGAVEGDAEREVTGRNLLMAAFYSLPSDVLRHFDDPDEWVPRFGRFISNGVVGAVRMRIASMSHQEVREGNDQLEREVARYLLLQPGNPLYGIFALELLDVEVFELRLPEDTEEALRAKENADFAGKATAATARHNRDAANANAEATRIQGQADADALKAKAQALKDAGGSPDLAALQEGRGGEQGLGVTFQDIMMVRMLLLLGQQQPPP